MKGAKGRQPVLPVATGGRMLPRIARRRERLRLLYSRRALIEREFAHLKREHGLAALRVRGLERRARPPRATRDIKTPERTSLARWRLVPRLDDASMERLAKELLAAFQRTMLCSISKPSPPSRWSVRSRSMGFRADQLLYHYTTRDAALNFILPTGRIRFSLTRHMNDPRETKKWIIFPDRDVDAPGYPQTEKDLFAFSDRVSGLMQATTKILSLTRDAPADDRFYVFAHGWSHSRMWTHYGGHQTGVCLVFNAQALARAIRTALRERGDLWHYPVTYADEELDESRAFRIDYSRITQIGLEAAVSEHIGRHHEVLFFRKNTDWASEWEYRWVFRSPEPAPVFVPIRAALRQVIRGDAFPDSELDSYRHLLNDYPHAKEGLFRWMNGGPFLLPGTGSGGLHARIRI